MWGREPRDLPLGCFPISPTWSLESPTPACASVTWSPVRLHQELPVFCALSAGGLALRPYIPPLPLTVYSSSDLVGAAHLARAHPAGALFCGPR